MRYKIEGNWKNGLAFDLHTVVSVYLGVDEHGHDRFDNTRSEIGELIYQLKYRSDRTVVTKIIELLSPIKGIESFDAIIPVPSSKARALQPVDVIAQALGNQRGVPVLIDYLKKAGNVELKGIDDKEERAKALENSITISGKEDISGKKVLLLDDLFRSGVTLNACCNVLLKQVKISEVSVLTMTKTRSKR